MIRQVKGSIASVSILMPKEGSKSAVNVTNGMYKVMIGQKMRTLDKNPRNSHQLSTLYTIRENQFKMTPSMVFIGVFLNFGILEHSRI